MLRDISEQVRLATISATTRSALPSITFTSKALRFPITRFCSIFTYPHARKAAPPAADRLGVLLHL